MRKKGYFFLIDAIIALFILSGGIALLFSFDVKETPSSQIELTSNDLFDRVFTRIRIEDLNNPYWGAGGTYVQQGIVTSIDHTILQQAAEFYYLNKTQGCTICVDEYLPSLLSNASLLQTSQTSFEVFIDDTSLYLSAQTAKSNATKIIPRKKIVYGLYNRTELFGPYVVEVQLWQ